MVPGTEPEETQVPDDSHSRLPHPGPALGAAPAALFMSLVADNRPPEHRTRSSGRRGVRRLLRRR
jgi:hypothetical protein